MPYILKRFIPFFNTGFKTYVFLLFLTGPFTAIAYWTAASTYGPRKNEKVALPGRPIEEYLDIKDPELKQQFHGHNKINYQQFHDAYFEGKIDVKGEFVSKLVDALLILLQVTCLMSSNTDTTGPISTSRLNSSNTLSLK